MTDSELPRTVRFGRMPTKGVLLGLSGLRVSCLGAAAGLVVLGLFLGSRIVGALLSVPVLILALAAVVPVAGRPAIEWLPVAGHWAVRRTRHQTKYLARPCHPRPAGTLALPGEAAALRIHVDPVTGAAMVHDPHRRTLTATAAVSHPAFVLLGSGEQNRRVTGWGRVLAAVAGNEQISSIQIMESTLPDTGREVLAFWEQHGVHDESWTATNYRNLIDRAAPASSRHRTTISITLDLGHAARTIRRHGRGLTGAAAVLRQDMGTLQNALRAADLPVSHWLGAQELAALIRGAYQPAAVSDQPAREGGTSLATAGPVGIAEEWDHFLADDHAYTAVLWVSEWPRSEVFPNFLHPLILKTGVHKSFTLLAHPVPARDAIRSIRRQKVDCITDAEQKARVGQLADLSDSQEYQDLLDRERELLAGHTDLLFAGFVAVTAGSKDQLDAAVAEVQRAAISCGCETRRLVGQQSQAFTAAALPLGRGL